MLGSVRLVFAATLLVATYCCDAQTHFARSGGKNAPAVALNKEHQTVNIYYGHERIGRKIAIRQAYLVPIPGFDKTNCNMSSRCGDFHESVQMVLDIQSIWPEPVLLTAARLERLALQSKRPDPGFGSATVLGEQITRQFVPSTFLLQPGEIKRISLERGLRLDGLMDFFTDEIRGEMISGTPGSLILHNQRRVNEFNHFLARKFGKQAALRLTIFEKDYQSILTTTFLLAQGGDAISTGNVLQNKYKLQHDVFLAEAVHLLHDADKGIGQPND